MKVAVLGCGPAGLVAAHAVASSGNNVHVYSKKVRSAIFGAQYLHKPIPDVPAPDPTLIRYRMQGTPEQYLRKVYGPLWDGTISDDLRDQEHLAYDMRRAYWWLWAKYEPIIVNMEFDPITFDAYYAQLTDGYDMVISTLPRPSLCKTIGHNFKSTRIFALGDTDERKVDFPCDDGDVIYNGEDSPSWYRLANIYGFKTVEWPNGNRPPVEEVASVSKPLTHNCDCWPDILYAGRFGRWQRDKLVHDVFWDVYEAIMIATIKEQIR